jgi:hypothetical protein
MMADGVRTYFSGLFAFLWERLGKGTVELHGYKTLGAQCTYPAFLILFLAFYFWLTTCVGI